MELIFDYLQDFIIFLWKNWKECAILDNLKTFNRILCAENAERNGERL